MLAIAVLLVALLLAGVALVINSSYARFVRSELQAAADAAAHAGAKEICASIKCWASAKAAAVEMLGSHTAHGDLKDELELAVKPEGGPVWDYSKTRNLIVTIERGRYLPARGFESMEGDWAAAHPGVPLHAAFNAVRVKVERPAVELLGATIATTLWSVSSEATAIAAPIDPVCVAPFAIPVCHILGNSGSLDMCGRDTLFTQADRYCDSGASDCQNRPSFPYELCRPDARAHLAPHRAAFDSGEGLKKWISGGEFKDYAELWTHWEVDPTAPHCFTSNGTPFPGSAECRTTRDEWYVEGRGVTAADHFGVVGAPGEQLISEGQIQVLLSRANPCIQARLGDRFTLLHEGLRDQATDDLLWEQIADLADPAPDAAHPSFADAGLGTVEHNLSFFNWNEKLACGEITPERGVCNSRRFVADTANSAGPGLPYLPFKPAPGINDRTPVWEVRIPVIANVAEDAAACSSDFSSMPDPIPTDADEFEIIGFVKVHLFDVDIGSPSPPLPSVPKGLEAAGAWGFKYSIMGGEDQCNLVRGRVSCGSSLLATSDPSNKRPMFIEQPLEPLIPEPASAAPSQAGP